MREHGDGLGAADGIDLLHAEQGADGEDAGVRQPTELTLRGRGDRDGGDAGDQGGHNVHDDAGGQRGEAARHVEADTLDGDVAELDSGAVGEDGGPGVGVEFQGSGHRAAAADRLEERLLQLRVELVGGLPEVGGSDPQRRRDDVVELL